MRLLFTLFALFLPLCCPAQPQMIAAQYSLDDIMGAGDQNAAGINTLNAQQLANLEEWINLWTVKTINQVLLMGCKCTTQDCLTALVGRMPTSQMYAQQQESPQQPAPVQEQRSNNPYVNQEQGNYSLLTENLRNGGLLRLDDGSMWQVSPTDQTRAAAWHRADRIQVQPGQSYGQFTLFNLTRNSQVNAARPGEAIRPGNPFLGDTFRQTHTFSVRQNLNDGEVLILDDGNAYVVRLPDRYKYSKFWAPGTPVVVTRQGGLYPYSLKNSQTGNFVQADLQHQ